MSRLFDRRSFERLFLAGEFDVCREVLASTPAPGAVLGDAKMMILLDNAPRKALEKLLPFQGTS